MPITFNVDEIFEMAEEMEKNGAKFYRKAAQNTSDSQTKQLLLDMADMEDNHLQTFREMRQQLSGRETEDTMYDPENEAAMYLQAMADSHGYEGKIAPDEELTGKETPKEILEIALNSEKESVVFYSGLKSLVSPKAGRGKVKAIIREELGHITTLLNKLKAL